MILVASSILPYCLHLVYLHSDHKWSDTRRAEACHRRLSGWQKLRPVCRLLSCGTSFRWRFARDAKFNVRQLCYGDDRGVFDVTWKKFFFLPQQTNSSDDVMWWLFRLLFRRFKAVSRSYVVCSVVAVIIVVIVIRVTHVWLHTTAVISCSVQPNVFAAVKVNDP